MTAFEFYGLAFLIFVIGGVVVLAAAIASAVYCTVTYGEFMGLKSSRWYDGQTTRQASPKVKWTPIDQMPADWSKNSIIDEMLRHEKH